MSALIRLARADDLPALVELQQEVHELHLQARPDQFHPISNEKLAVRVRDLLASSVTKVWVAELDGAVCAYLVAIRQVKPESPYSPALQSCQLDQIGVRAKERRKGLGRALIGAAVADARAAGILQIELNSWGFNEAAHRVFESLGFVRKAIRFELRS